MAEDVSHEHGMARSRRRRGDSNRPTLLDVAELACVSPATVSRVVNRRGDVAEATRQRVAAAVARLDYIPDQAARSLAIRHIELVALAARDVSALVTFSSDRDGDLVGALTQLLALNNIGLVVCVAADWYQLAQALGPINLRTLAAVVAVDAVDHIEISWTRVETHAPLIFWGTSPPQGTGTPGSRLIEPV